MEPQKSAPETLARIARAGDRLATLRALRDRIALDIDLCDSKRDLASLSARLVEVLAQIDAEEKASPAVKGTPLDELAKRRRSAPAAKVRTARS